LKYEHLYRAIIGDGNALAVEINCFRQTYNALRPHQALDDRTPRQVLPDRPGEHVATGPAVR